MEKKFYKEDNEPIPSIVYSETQPVGYSEITDQAKLSELYLKLNNNMKQLGRDYVSSFKVSSFGLLYRDGTLTDANINYLYNKLTQLLLRLEDGNFDSAKFLLENELNTITQDDIDNGYTQAIHDQILNDITNYLN
jgi:hypothetical protein